MADRETPRRKKTTGPERRHEESDDDKDEDFEEEEKEKESEQEEPPQLITEPTQAQELPATTGPTKRKRGRPRKEEQAARQQQQQQQQQQAATTALIPPKRVYKTKGYVPHPRTPRAPKTAQAQPTSSAVAAGFLESLAQGWQRPAHPSLTGPETMPTATQHEIGLHLPEALARKVKLANAEVPALLNRFDGVASGDVLAMNVGGPIWALDWCPTSPTMPQAIQFLAVSCHRTCNERHAMDKNTTGPNAIQIWSVPTLRNADVTEGRPVLEMLLLHDGDTVWDMQWCPTGGWIEESAANPSGRIGLLACAMNNGAIAVYSIPNPRTRSIGQFTTGTTVALRLAPVFTASTQNAHPTSLQWSWFREHTFILAGYSDGHARVWQIGDPAAPFFDCACCKNTVRGVQWSTSTDHHFAVSSWNYSAEAVIWSIHNPFAPLQVLSFSGISPPTRIAWSPINCVSLATDDGVLGLGWGLVDTHVSQPRVHTLCIWDICCNNRTLQTATVSEDGTVALVPGTPRRSHSEMFCGRLASLRFEGDTLVHSSAIQLMLKDIGHGPIGPLEVALHRVRWCPDDEGKHWLAYGGTYGIVFIQRVNTDVSFT
jgi:WD40 repeat protein